MKIYIYLGPNYETSDAVHGGACLVQAEPVTGGREYKVHHPTGGYSVWPVAQFQEAHRVLTAKERSLINMSTAELEVMGISDNALALV